MPHDPTQPPRPTTTRPSRAGGVIIAITTLVGTVWGGVEGQMSAGLLLGLGTGAVLSVLLWLWDRKRG